MKVQESIIVTLPYPAIEATIGVAPRKRSKNRLKRDRKRELESSLYVKVLEKLLTYFATVNHYVRLAVERVSEKEVPTENERKFILVKFDRPVTTADVNRYAHAQGWKNLNYYQALGAGIGSIQGKIPYYGVPLQEPIVVIKEPFLESNFNYYMVFRPKNNECTMVSASDWGTEYWFIFTE